MEIMKMTSQIQNVAAKLYAILRDKTQYVEQALACLDMTRRQIAAEYKIPTNKSIPAENMPEMRHLAIEAERILKAELTNPRDMILCVSYLRTTMAFSEGVEISDPIRNLSTKVGEA